MNTKTQTTTIALTKLGFVKVSGENATTFLQGQLTCDVNTIDNGSFSPGACCDHKGRMLANFFVFRVADDFYLLLPREMVVQTIAHLKKYAVFSKVTVTTPDEKWEAAPPVDLSVLELASIENGFTFIYPETSGLFTPQMINLQLMNGVSFTKGCYVGQEVVARTEHLGKLKRHLYRAEVKCNTAPQPGDKIYQNDQEIGVVTVSAPNKNGGYALLAVIQDRALERKIELRLLDDIVLYHLKNLYPDSN